MKLLDLSLPSPAENLALDEALLDWCESGQGEETLRFWESPQVFVVVGYANKVDLETNRAACEAANVPILRRCSGGGTVVQGPGCLNYNLVLNIEANPELQTIPQTNNFVMERQRKAMEGVMKGAMEYWSNGVLEKQNNSTTPSLQHSAPPPPLVRGHTDLALGNLKFSGNAQRRKRHFLVFHGTFLLNFDLPLISRLLRMPSKEPDYRENRSHEQFITNLQIPADQIKAALRDIWSAREPLTQIPDYQTLVRERYSRPEWNLKF
ncbi:MAG: biotin/lipoate A/B protein ligase family protein [Limisphaerales bacterium]